MSDRDPELVDIDPLERYDNREAATDYADWLDGLTPDEIADEMQRLAPGPAGEHR